MNSSPKELLDSASPALPTADELLEALPWGVLVLDAQGTIRRLNQQAATWCGAAPAALLGQLLAEAPLPPALGATLRQLLDLGAAEPREVWLAPAQQWLSLRLGPAPAGQHWVYWEDVTARQQAEAARQRSSQLLLDMEAVAHTGSYEADLLSGGFYFSDGMYRLFGEAPQAFEVTLESIDARSHPTDAATVRQVLDEAVRTGQPYTYYRRIRRTDGAWRTLEAHGEVRCDATGQPTQLRGLVQDVTERVQAEQAQRASHELLQRTIDSSLDLVQVFEAVRDEQGAVVDFAWVLNNAAAERVYGNVVGRRLCEQNPGVVKMGIFDTFKKVLETGVPDQTERHYVHEQFAGWFYQSTVKLGDGVATTTHDITERKQAHEEILRLQEALAQHATDKYRTLFTSIDEGFCLLERVSGRPVDFVYVEVNDAFARQLGTSGVVGRTMRDAFPGAPEAGYALYERVWQTGAPVHTELAVPSIGRILDVQAFRVDNGPVRQVAVVFSDITERKRREADAALLVAITEDLNRLTGEEELLAAIGAHLAQHFDLDCWHYVDVDETRAEVTVRHFWHAQAVPPILGTYPLAGFLSPAAVARMRAGAAVVADVQATIPSDSAAGRALQAGAAAQHIAAYIAVPYSVGGQWQAYFALADSRPRPWTDAETALVQDVAAHVFPRVERARTEAALRASEQRLRLVTDATPALIAYVDAGLRYRFNNARYRDWFGQRPEELRGRTLREVVGEAAFAELQPRAEAALAGQRQSFEAEMMFEKIGLRHVQTEFVPDVRPDGSVAGYYSLVVDLTARKQVEDALRQSEEKYRTLFDSIDEGFNVLELLVDDQGQPADFLILQTNRVWQQQTGLADAVGQTLREVTPGLEPALLDTYAEVARSGQAVRLEYYTAVVGRWYTAFATRIGGADSRQIAVVFDDITERKQREQQQEFLLKLSDALRAEPNEEAIGTLATRLVAEHLHVDRCYIAQLSRAQELGRIGPEYRAAGLPPLSGQYRFADFPEGMKRLETGPLIIRDLLHDPSLSDTDKQSISQQLGVQGLLAAILRRGERHYFWGLYAATTQPRDWTEADLKFLENVAERTWAAMERARTAEALAASEAKYRTLFNTMDEGFCVMELVFEAPGQVVDIIYREANAAFAQHTGLGEVVGQRASKVFPHIEQHWLGSLARVQHTGVPERVEGYNTDTRHWFTVQYSRVGGEGSLLVAAVFNDITERKRREANLSLLAEVSEDLVRLTDTDETLNALGQKLAAHFELSACVFAELVEDAQVGIIRTGWHRADMPSLLGTYRMADFVAPEVLRRCRAGEPVVIRNVFTDPLTDGPQYAAIHVRSFVSIPLVRQGEWHFLLVVYRSEPHDWHETEIALLQEITARIWTRLERARAEEALAASEARLRALISNLPGAAAFVVGPDLRYQLAGGEALDAAGLTPADLLGRTVAEAMPPELVPQYEDHYRQALAGQGFSLEHTAHGRTFVTRGVPLLGAAGQPEAVLVVSYDISARKQAEEDLRASEAQLAALNTALEQRVAERTHELQTSRDLLQSVLDTSLISMSVLHAVRDEAGQVQDFRLGLVNKKLEHETGRTDLVGKLYAQEYPGVRQVGIFDLMLRALATDEPQTLEYFYDHEGFHQWYTCQFVKMGDGVVATNLDITERKLAEQERLKNLRLLEQAEAVAGLGSWDYDLATSAMRWSEGMYQLLHLPLGQPVSPAVYLQLVADDDRPRAEQLVRQLTTGQSVEETLRLRAGEQVKTVRLKAVVLRDEAGHPTRVLGVDLDISELQRLEADNLRLRLGQQQALFEAVQAAQETERKRMAESLHNGIGQILYATKLRLDQLHAPILGTHPTLVAARREADQLLGEAIRQTRALSHELVSLVLEEFGLAAALQDISRKMSTPKLRFYCHVELDEAAMPLAPPLQMALYRMAQELAQNVVKHARGATEATLELETMPGWVLLRAEDNGPGFIPAAGPPLGLGLRSIRDRVALLGGQLDRGALPSGGAYVRIRIPLHPPVVLAP